MNLEQIKKEHRVIDLFCELAEIPSPSGKEKQVSERIIEILSIHGIAAKYDTFGNVIAKIPASSGCKNIPSLLLSAHMDVVGGSDAVNLKLSKNGVFIETDKTRTLGADNKAGVAAIMDLLIGLNSLDSKTSHGMLEATFTKDEEMGMTGIRNLDTSKLKSKYVIVADGEKLGEHDVAGAGFTNVYINVTGGKGGHSGINISDIDRISAIKILTEIDSKIPQGVFKQTDKGVVTSINAGVIIGGSAGGYFNEAIKDTIANIKTQKNILPKYAAKEAMKTISQESPLNIISSEAYISYSLRSSEIEPEEELLNIIKNIVSETEKKYNGKIKVEVVIQKHLKPFLKSENNPLSKAISIAANNLEINSKESVFHAGAETHIYANEKTNEKGEKFLPILVGLANIENMHSSDEKLDWKSLAKGREWLEETINEFSKLWNE
ncbi:MAG: M20/M25/M40 family metallo-hydrolase [bacterium]